MEIYFTVHAVKRMIDRNITAKEINEVFANNYLVYSKKGYTLIGKINTNRYLTLVINLKNKTLVTLWPSKRKERNLYEEKITPT